MHPEQHAEGESNEVTATPGQAVDPRERIETAMAGLDGVEDLPVGEHVERFDAVHSALTDALSDIDKV